MHYNRFIYAVIFALFCLPMSAQEIPNAGMEVWNEDGNSGYPEGWLSTMHTAMLPCNPPPVTIVQSEDSYSGEWAARLRAVSCIDDKFSTQIFVGIMMLGYTADTLDAFHGIAYSERPSTLHFAAKYQPVNNDTALAVVSLLKEGSNGGTPLETIGHGQFVFNEPIDNYETIAVPIEYSSTAQPDILQLVFTTGDTLETGLFEINTEPGQGEFEGTQLWIDEIALSGGTLGQPEKISMNSFEVAPNPTSGNFTIRFDKEIKKPQIQVFDNSGRLIKHMGFNRAVEVVRLDLGAVSPGMYPVKIETQEGVSTGKLIVE